MPQDDQSTSEPQATNALDPTDPIRVTLSAHTNNELQVGHEQDVTFRIEMSLSIPAQGASLDTEAKPDQPIVVSLMVADDQTIGITAVREIALHPPTSQQPLRTGSFRIQGLAAGVCRLAVFFGKRGAILASLVW